MNRHKKNIKNITAVLAPARKKNHPGERGHQVPPLPKELLAIGSCQEENQFSLRVWALVGRPPPVKVIYPRVHGQHKQYLVGFEGGGGEHRVG